MEATAGPATSNGTTYPYSYLHYPHWPFGLVSMTCFLVGAPTNLLSLTYFVSRNREKSSYVRQLYILMNAVDLVICCLFLPTALSMFTEGAPLLFGSLFLCTVWGYVMQIVARLSVFCIGLVSIFRTLSVMLPFIRLSLVHILVPIGGYTTILLIQQSIPFWYGKSYHFLAAVGGCGWAIDDIFAITSSQYKVLTVLLIVVEYILPLFPILLSCVLSCYQLRVSPFCSTDPSLFSKNSCENKLIQESLRTKRSATITIILLTIAYILFNLPYCVIMVGDVVAMLSEHTVFLQILPTRYFLLTYVSITFYSIPLNSTVNPLIYIMRIARLREHIWGVVGKVRGWRAGTRSRYSLEDNVREEQSTFRISKQLTYKNRNHLNNNNKDSPRVSDNSMNCF